MSSDPKKPTFDAPPDATPDLLQKELNLDRRRRVPSFTELQAQGPEAATDPVRPAVARPPPSPSSAAEQWNAEQARQRAAAQGATALVPQLQAAPTAGAVPLPGARPAPVAGAVPLPGAAPQARSAPLAGAAPQARPAPIAGAVPLPGAAPQARPAPIAGAVPLSAAAPQARPAPISVPLPGAAPQARPAPIASAVPLPGAAPQARPTPIAGGAPVPGTATQAHAAPLAGAVPLPGAAPQARSAPLGDVSPQARMSPAAVPSPGGAPQTRPAPGAGAVAAPQARIAPPSPGTAPQARPAPFAGAVPLPGAAPLARPAAFAGSVPLPGGPQGRVNPGAVPLERSVGPSSTGSDRPGAGHLGSDRPGVSHLGADRPGFGHPGAAQQTGVLPHHPAIDEAPTREHAARVEPPSPVAFAQQRGALPQVTPAAPTQGAVVPEGNLTPLTRAEPSRPVQLDVHHDEPEPKTMPAAPAAQRVAPQTSPPPKPAVLPPEMLVTQPGLPGPFAQARAVQGNPAVPARPPSLPELPRAAQPAAPSFEAAAFDAPAAVPETSDVVTAEPASLWRRTGAWLSDLAFVAGLVLAFLFVAMTVIAPKNLTPLQQLMAVAAPGGALAAILAFVYTTIFAFLWNGRTPGRRLFGIHLVDTTGHAPGPARALIRAMLSLVSFGLFLSGFWLALFDRHGQTLHDKLTRTFVVKLQDA